MLRFSQSIGFGIMLGSNIVYSACFIFGLAIIQGVFVYCVYEALLGNPAQLGKSLSRAMTRIVHLILAMVPFTFVTVFFIFFLLLTLFMILFSPMFWDETKITGSIIIMIEIIGPIIFMIMTCLTLLFLWCKWSVFIPACVVERLNPIDSLDRSSVLTKGYRWKIAGLYLMCFVITLVVMTILKPKVIGLTVLEIGNWTSFVPRRFIIAVPMAFAQIMTAVIYFTLREARAGVTIDSLANMFD